MVKAEAATRNLVRPATKLNDTQIAASNLRAVKAFTQKRDIFLQARQAKLASMTAVTQIFINSKLKQSTVGGSGTQSGPLGTRSMKQQTGSVALAVDIAHLSLAPVVLTSVSPTKAKTGVTVVLTGQNLLPDKFFTTANASISTYWAGAMFTVAANVQKSGKLLAARKNADGTVSIDAVVPTTTGLVDAYNGNVCLYNGADKTNILSFRYESSGPPTITSTEPSILGPGDDLTIKGLFFSRDDKAYIDMGSGDVEIPITYYTDKQVFVSIPTYTSRTTNSRRFYIVHQFPYGWDGGPARWVTLRPTEVTIDSVFYTSGSTMISTNPQGQPGDPIVIAGVGFVNPKVHFIVANGVDKLGVVDFSNDSTIRTSVPVVTGVAGDYAGSVYVTCDINRKSNLVNFTFHPTIDYQMIDLYKFRPDSLGDMSFSTKPGWWAILPDDTTTPWISNILAGNHSGELLWGYRSDDIYFQTKRLKNNWKVSYIDLTIRCGGSRLDDSRLGTDSPYAKVHWWVEMLSYCEYFVSWHIQGPKGTTYY
jgi:hypothetical protein